VLLPILINWWLLQCSTYLFCNIIILSYNYIEFLVLGSNVLDCDPILNETYEWRRSRKIASWPVNAHWIVILIHARHVTPYLSGLNEITNLNRPNRSLAAHTSPPLMTSHTHTRDIAVVSVLRIWNCVSPWIAFSSFRSWSDYVWGIAAVLMTSSLPARRRHRADIGSIL